MMALHGITQVDFGIKSVVNKIYWPLKFTNSPFKKSKRKNPIYDFQLLPSKNKYLFMPQYAQSIKIRPPILDINVHGDLRKRRTLIKILNIESFPNTLHK